MGVVRGAVLVFVAGSPGCAHFMVLAHVPVDPAGLNVRVEGFGEFGCPFWGEVDFVEGAVEGERECLCVGFAGEVVNGFVDDAFSHVTDVRR